MKGGMYTFKRTLAENMCLVDQCPRSWEAPYLYCHVHLKSPQQRRQEWIDAQLRRHSARGNQSRPRYQRGKSNK